MSTCPHCGCDTAPPKAGKLRSVSQHRRYFAMIRAARMHWPDGHDFQPRSEEHLRKWLQCKAGYHTCVTVDANGLSVEDALGLVQAEIEASNKIDPYHFTKRIGPRFYIFRSQSVDFDALPHLAACALFDAVAEVIEAETGLRPEQIMPPVSQRRSKLAVEKMKLLAASL